MKYLITTSYLVMLFFVLSGCAAPLNTDTISFFPPSTYGNYKEINGLQIAVQPVDTKEKSDEILELI